MHQIEMLYYLEHERTVPLWTIGVVLLWWKTCPGSSSLWDGSARSSRAIMSRLGIFSLTLMICWKFSNLSGITLFSWPLLISVAATLITLNLAQVVPLIQSHATPSSRLPLSSSPDLNNKIRLLFQKTNSPFRATPSSRGGYGGDERQDEYHSAWLHQRRRYLSQGKIRWSETVYSELAMMHHGRGDALMDR